MSTSLITVRQKQKPRSLRMSREMEHFVTNLELNRIQLMKSVLDPPRRDLDDDCGYPKNLTVRHFKEMYDRNGIARRVVWSMASECWRQPIEIYQTDDQRNTRFEKAWEKLEKEQSLIHFMRRIDGLSGIGSFGILLLGFPGRLDTPVRGVGLDGKPNGKARKNTPLLYVRTCDQSVVSILKWETDRQSPRYGHPRMYGIQLDQLRDGQDEPDPASEMTPVHWTRVIHVAEFCENSEWFGVERQRPVFNYLLNIRKILGASAEMLWKGGFPGYSFEMDPAAIAQGAMLDKESIREEMALFQNHLQRYFAWEGIKVNSLSPQAVDPSKHFDTQLEAISITIEVPKRILLGSEIGQLASDQDKKNWNERLMDRQTNYLTPRLARPVVWRLIAAGVLPRVEDFKASWPDLNAPSGEAIAGVAEKQINAVYKYVVSGAYKLIPPTEFFTVILKMNLSDSIAIIKSMMASLKNPKAAKNAMLIHDQLEAEQAQEQADKQMEMKHSQQKELLQQKQIASSKKKVGPAKKTAKDKRAA